MAKSTSRRLLIAVLLGSVLPLPPAHAAELYGIVTATTLNVRTAPDTGSEVIWKLGGGSLVVLLESRAGWYRVGYVVGSQLRSGWVASAYVRLMIGADEEGTDLYGDEEECDESTARLTLSVDRAELDCREGLLSEGYERCDVEVEYTIYSDCDPDYGISKEVQCTVELKVTTADGFMPRWRTAHGSSYETIYSTMHSGSLEISERVAGLLDAVVAVRAESVACELW